jgi:hypothetical protein
MRANAPDEIWIPAVGETDVKRQAAVEDKYAECRNSGPGKGYLGSDVRWERAFDYPNFLRAHRSHIFSLADLVAYTVAGDYLGHRDTKIYELVRSKITDKRVFAPSADKIDWFTFDA